MGVQKASGGRQINVRWWEKSLGEQKLQWAQKAYKKNQKKSGDLFFFFFLTVKLLYSVGAPFEFSGRAPFKLVTPLIVPTLYRYI